MTKKEMLETLSAREVIEIIEETSREENSDGWNYFFGGNTKRQTIKALERLELFEEYWELLGDTDEALRHDYFERLKKISMKIDGKELK